MKKLLFVLPALCLAFASCDNSDLYNEEMAAAKLRTLTRADSLVIANLAHAVADEIIDSLMKKADDQAQGYVAGEDGLILHFQDADREYQRVLALEKKMSQISRNWVQACCGGSMSFPSGNLDVDDAAAYFYKGKYYNLVLRQVSKGVKGVQIITRDPEDFDGSYEQAYLSISTKRVAYDPFVTHNATLYLYYQDKGSSYLKQVLDREAAVKRFDELMEALDGALDGIRKMDNLLKPSGSYRSNPPLPVEPYEDVPG